MDKFKYYYIYGHCTVFFCLKFHITNNFWKIFTKFDVSHSYNTLKAGFENGQTRIITTPASQISS